MEIELHKLSVPSIEIRVLQNIFVDSSKFEEVNSIIKPAYFYDKKRQMIFEAMQILHSDFEEITYHTIVAHCLSRGTLGEGSNQLTPYDITSCGGTEEEALPNLGQNSYLAKTIAESYIKREFVINCGKSIQSVLNGKEDFITAINKQNELNGNLLNIAEGDRNKHISKYTESFLLENEVNGGNKFEIGFEKFDKKLSIQAGHFVVLGAGTSHGKTVLALNMARNFARDKRKVGIFSLEMTGEQLANRIISNEINFDSSQFLNKIQPHQLPEYNRGADIVDSYKFYVNDKAGLTISRLKSYAISMIKHHGVEVIIIDYLQLIKGEGRGKYEDTTTISQSLKVLAKDLKVPIIALSQFSRDFKKQNRLPVVSDLRDSGAIEQDADTILLYYNYAHEKIEPEDDEGRPLPLNACNLEVAKNRHGSCFEDIVFFNGKYQRITNDEELDEGSTFGDNNDFTSNQPF
jgi:replicative DNA helicase